MKTQEEIWKDIEGYEDLYQVSSFGRVKSLFDGRHKIFREKILKPEKNRGGYLYVILYKEGKPKTITVHRLVAVSFLKNPQNLETVNHKNEIKTDNRVENLEWMTWKDNHDYGTRNKRVAEALSKRVLQYTLDGVFVREWPSASEAGRNGFEFRNISACCLGKRKSHKGYIWKFA